MTNENEEKLIFSEALAEGMLFLPRAQFKAGSLLTNLREEDIIFPGSIFPTMTQIKTKINSSLNIPFYNNCIAFSIKQNRTVIYKYQLFYEDLELVPSTTIIDKKVGVYIRSLDDFYKLRPFIDNVGIRTYGASGGNTQGRSYGSIMANLNPETYRQALDGAWTMMSWDLDPNNSAPICALRSNCGRNMTYALHHGGFLNLGEPGNTVQRAIIKPRRVSEIGFEFYVTSNNELSDNWYWIARKEGYSLRYWVIAGPGNPTGQGGVRPQFTIDSNNSTTFLYSSTNRFPFKQGAFSTEFSNEVKQPFTVFPRSDNAGIEALHISTDCNMCMLSTDNRGNTCFGGTNAGALWIIQPSLAFVLGQILNANEYNLALNLCVRASSQGSDNLIEPARYPLTNTFLATNSKFIPRTAACNNIRSVFCQQNNPETKQSNLFTTTCKDFCKNEFDCTGIVTQFCNAQDDPLDTTNRSICACSIRDVPKVKQVYDRFVTEYERKGLRFPNCNEPRYVFSPCRTSDYGSSDGRTNQPPPNASVCGSNINCVSYVEIDNKGTITGDIDVGVDQKDCATIINAITSNTVDCQDSSDCSDEKENKFCINSKCAQCNTDSDCGVGTPKCNTRNVCVQCLQNTDCKGDLPACVGNICAECSTTADCGAGKKCAGNICVNDDTNKTTTTSIALYAGIGVLVLVLILVLMFKRKKRL